MKKIMSILVVELLYLTAFHFIIDFLQLGEMIKHFGAYSIAAQIFLEEIPIIALMLLLNHFIWKQKVIFKKYPLGKGLGVSFYTILMFCVAIGAGIYRQVEVGVFIALFVGAISIGLAEEFVFRGLILGHLISKGKSLLFSMIVSSILFACLHLVNIFHQPLLNTFLQVLYVFPLGMFLAAIYIKTNNLMFAIFLHAMQDFAALVFTGGVSSQVTSLSAVLMDYALYLTLTLIILYADSQQIARFKAFLKNIPAQLGERSLPTLAKNKMFRSVSLVVVLVFGIIANFWYVFAITSNVQQALAAGETQPGATPGNLAMGFTIFLSILFYLVVMTFFDYKKSNFCWLLIPVVGGPVFVIIALTKNVRPKFEQKIKHGNQQMIR
ncbi:MAG: CPBP family intramembrane metalloprotease [Streptococcaceae bacterium]|nr:CPBP family intramembrane metalloprotease [Streptococcaceae bacterium]